MSTKESLRAVSRFCRSGMRLSSRISHGPRQEPHTFSSSISIPAAVRRSLCNGPGSESGGRSSMCWNCGARSVFLACPSCRSVQPVDLSIDFFRIFDLPRGYEINDNLEGKYKDWQKKLHPDLVHSKSEDEKDFAAEQSARVIDAYSTLRQPLSRALYLLQLEGVHVDEEKTIENPELLAEMIEIREAVEEARSSLELEDMRFQLQNNFDCWSRSFGDALKKRDFATAVASTHRMRYYERAIEEIIKKL